MNLVEAYNRLRSGLRAYFKLYDEYAEAQKTEKGVEVQHGIWQEVIRLRLEVEELLAIDLVPSLMGMENLKEERTKQWANQQGNAKGWDNYRASTFCEVIRAKWDRALQAQQLIADARSEVACLDRLYIFAKEHKMAADIIDKLKVDINAHDEKMKKLEFDGVDSIKDAFNYSRECLQQIEETPELYTANRLR